MTQGPNDREEQRTRSFNPNEHLMQVSGKDYLPVAWRLVWFREQAPEGIIETEMLHLDLDRETEDEVMVWSDEQRKKIKVTKRANGFVMFRARVADGKGGKATATKSEKAASFPDFIEKCETGAVGRALAMLGYGTQFTGDELDEAHRIVDSPVDRQPAAADTDQPTNTKGAIDTTPATDQQLASIQKLSKHLGKIVETPATYGAASLLLKSLSAEYNRKKAS